MPRQSVGYFAAVRLRDGDFNCRETDKFNGAFFAFLKVSGVRAFADAAW